MKQLNIDNGQNFDFGKTSKDYAKYRDIYPQILFDKLLELGVGKPNTKWLDLGTGTGVFPRALGKYGAEIVGTDISENQIEQAKILSSDYKNINYKVCPAENTGFNDNSFDAITACQCFWYFDPQKIVPEIKRLLKPNGVFVKVYMGWAKGDVISDGSQSIIKTLNPEWTSDKQTLKDLKVDYFENPIKDHFFIDLPFTRESWHGRMVASRGVGGSMSEENIKKFNKQHIEFLNDFPEEFNVKHEIFITAYIIHK